MSDLLLRLRAMPSSLNDACRIMDDAADYIEALEEALREIAKGSVRAREIARELLDKNASE